MRKTHVQNKKHNSTKVATYLSNLSGENVSCLSFLPFASAAIFESLKLKKNIHQTIVKQKTTHITTIFQNQ